MALITSYGTLQSELKDEFDRSDDTSSPWTRFIEQAESELDSDPRIRNMQAITFAVDAEEESLPSGFVELVALNHDGGTHFDPIDIVAPDALPRIKAITDTDTGVPVAASIIGRDTIRFAPVPDQTYTLDMVYWEGVPRLGGGVLNNWLLDDHPDIYLLACVVEAAHYFRDGEKLATVPPLLERKIEKLHQDRNRAQFGGTLTRPINPIG